MSVRRELQQPQGPCPRDGNPAFQSARYPDALCPECVAAATDLTGRAIAMGNVSAGGGFLAVHVDDGTTCEQVVADGRVLIDGVEHVAGEAYMSGIVVEPVRRHSS